MTLAPVPSLDEIAAKPEAVRGLPHQALVDLALKAQGVLNACWSAMLKDLGLPRRAPATEPMEERLLTARQVAERLGYGVDHVYRHARTWPFTIRTPGRRPRFSERGLEAWLKQQQTGT